MDSFSIDALRELAGPKGFWCVSIYMPTIMKSQQIRQNPIRFKNLLDQVRDELANTGMDPGQLGAFFAPGDNLLREEFFWPRQDPGLAVFLTRDFFRYYPLPGNVEEQAVVSDRFYLKPLLPFIGHQEAFFILAISQKQVRLLKATEHEVEQVNVPDMPENMQDTLGFDETRGSLSQYSRGTGSGLETRGGGRQSLYHGHGEGADKRKDYLVNYMHKVEKAVTGYLEDNTAPLILACVEYLQPLYKEANTYVNLSDELVPGNPDDIKNTHLRDEAWKRIKPIFQTVKQMRVDRYRMLSGRKDPLAVKDVAEIVKYAPYGRIDVLFVDKNAKRWGTFNEKNNKVKFENEQRPGNQDLLDFAAIQTLLNGGEVIPVDPEELPESGSPVEAIFRY